MAYLIFANEQEADNRSRDAWEQVLDRPKNVEDVTEFLWGRTRPGLDGRMAVEIPADTTQWGITQSQAALVEITAQEQSRLVPHSIRLIGQSRRLSSAVLARSS
jgi:hypothetical protein